MMPSSSFDIPGLGNPSSSYKPEAAPDFPSPTEPSHLYMPVMRPPTPAPSPRPVSPLQNVISLASSFADPLVASPLQVSLNDFRTLGPIARQDYLAALLTHCSSRELFFISTRIAPLLKRDFLADLPIELALHILNFVDHPRTLTRIACVSRKWYALVQDEQTWRGLASAYHFDLALHGPGEMEAEESDATGVTHSNSPHVLTLPRLPRPPRALQQTQSSQALFKYAWSTCTPPTSL
jgi:F-box and WD-40 domain protein CDC4